MKKEYKKINLRDFRHNLTQLKDSLNAGQIYEVIDRGETLAYFIPPEYEIKLSKDTSLNSAKVENVLENAIGCVKMSEKEKKNFDYKKEYGKYLRDRYVK